jgi:hypothetical protein
MPISFTCVCGRALRVKDDMAGRKARCPVCGQVLTVPVPQPRAAEDEALEILFVDDSVQAQPPPPPAAAVPRATPIPRPPQTPPLALPPRQTPFGERPKKRPKKRRRRSSEGWGGGIAIHPSILAGVGMMIGAVVWFVVGLAAGWIYFYPPILFVLGIVAVVKGFMGSE